MRRQRPAHEQLPTSTLGDRFKSMMGATVGKSSQDDNIRELNTKLTRMLEEEMIKNLQLKNVSLGSLLKQAFTPKQAIQLLVVTTTVVSRLFKIKAVQLFTFCKLPHVHQLVNVMLLKCLQIFRLAIS